MSDLVNRIATAKKELLALKTGFTSQQSQFDSVVVTEQSTVLPSAGVTYRIRTDFTFQDYPQLYAEAIEYYPLPVIYVNPQGRTSLYQWQVGPFSQPNTDLNLLLVSFKTPTTFVVEAI